MSEEMGATFHVGGALSQETADALEEIVSGMESVALILKKGEVLIISDSFNYGAWNELDDFVAKHGLVCWHHTDAKYEYGGTIEIHTPGVGWETCLADQDGNPTITHGDLMVAINEGKTLQDVANDLGRYSSYRVPPLTLEPARQPEAATA